MAFLLFVVLLSQVLGFQPRQHRHETLGKLHYQSRRKVVRQQQRQQLRVLDGDGSCCSSTIIPPPLAATVISRQRWLRSCLSLGIASLPNGIVTQEARAAAPPTAGGVGERNDIIWLTGKDPVVPGQPPRDKNDVKGTRKDPNFLRSLADCKNQCENSAGSDGLARSKETCLSDCQDICCQTYQQCTFGIVPRI